MNNTTIRTSVEGKRGCGYRKPGGLYLVSEQLSHSCGKLPLNLTVCPCCGAGIKYARGWTWINPAALFGGRLCAYEGGLATMRCSGLCPLSDANLGRIEKAGLIWVGREFYTVEGFALEAARLGVSRRIKAIPRGFKVGETWVCLAHLDGGVDNGKKCPAIFSMFQPRAIEYIIKGDETAEELDKLTARGLDLVRVVRAPEDNSNGHQAILNI